MRYSTTSAPDSAGRIKATVTFNGEKVRVNVGVTVKPNEWNAKKNEVKANVVIGGDQRNLSMVCSMRCE